jgi:hypothetical protein
MKARKGPRRAPTVGYGRHHEVKCRQAWDRDQTDAGEREAVFRTGACLCPTGLW